MALRVKINPEKIPDRDQPLSIFKLSAQRAGREILRDISFETAAGEIVGISGAHGSGKSTLISAIAGTLTDDVEIDFYHALHNGTDLMDKSAVRRYRAGVHCVSNETPLTPSLSVRDNLGIAMSSSRAASRRIKDIIELFPAMNDVMGKKASQCTAGQQRIVQIARAIMIFPSVLILDEPTHGLDATSIAAVAEALTVMVTGSVSVLIVDARRDFIGSLAHRSFILESGTLHEPLGDVSRAAEWKPQ